MTSPTTQLRYTRFDTTSEVRFPDDFRWGAATASYQIEGAHDEDGRTPSIWDTFSRTPGAVVGGENGDVACDHYHRMPQDVALMKELGLSTYRFSVAWPRVRPDGGPLNQAGIDFYSRLVDELLEAGIDPWITLYHWDLPQALEDVGGWTNRDVVDRFTEYSLSVYDALDDRVADWTTLNEPWCSAMLGYTGGQHAPGRQEGAAGLVAAHHLMLAHGQTVAELRRRGATPELGKHVGITLNLTDAVPHDPTDPVDLDAARRIDSFFNRLFLEPIFHGRYSDDLFADTIGMDFDGRPWRSFIHDGDLATIHQPLDCLGINYYHADIASGRPHNKVLGSGVETAPRPTSSPWPGGDDIVFPRGDYDVTSLDWEIQPEGLTNLLLRLARDYDVPPMYITENGAASYDEVGPDGAVHDHLRLDYIDQHLRAIRAAMDGGADVRGYFAWSLLDNFEWAYGYAQRFGIVHVDYETQVRTVKDSGHWFSSVAASGRVPARQS